MKLIDEKKILENKNNVLERIKKLESEKIKDQYLSGELNFWRGYLTALNEVYLTDMYD